MYNAGKVIVGIAIFLVLITFPIWYNAATGQATYVPELEKPVGQEQCVEDTEYMTAFHMDLLNAWRDEVVRSGERFYIDDAGGRVEKSLTNTCLSCHVNKDRFCDKCHDYMGVEPYCWDCHIVPEEVADVF
jgi:hypothetical protein